MTHPDPVAEQVARELHAAGVHTRCTADCAARFAADAVPGYTPADDSPGAPASYTPAAPTGYAPAAPTGYAPAGYAPAGPSDIPPAGFDAPPVPPRRSRRKPLLTAGGAVLAAAALVGVLLATGVGGDAGKALTIKFSLFDPSGDGGDCASGGTGGYGDINPGTPVTVKDENGKILASTELPDTGEDAGNDMGCTWTMKVMVPDNAAQYGVEIGRRGTVTYSHDKLAAQHWTVETGIS